MGSSRRNCSQKRNDTGSGVFVKDPWIDANRRIALSVDCLQTANPCKR